MDLEILLLLQNICLGVFYVLLLIFVIHLVFLGYHWLNYGTNKKIAHKAIALYLVGGALLFIVMGAMLFKM